jgi:hypothetical protein
VKAGLVAAVVALSGLFALGTLDGDGPARRERSAAPPSDPLRNVAGETIARRHDAPIAGADGAAFDPFAGVTGVVLDPAGEPVVGATVEASRIRAGRREPLRAPVLTGVRGTFRIAHLHEGGVLPALAAGVGAAAWARGPASTS